MPSYSSSAERPALPPLRTLNLLPTSCAQHQGGSPYDSYEASCPRLHVPQHSWLPSRRVSTSTSRTPSPTPSDTPSNTSSTSSPTSPSNNPKLTLIPSSFADAEAVIVISPPGAPNVPGQALLLTGPALKRLRHAQRRLAQGTRVHPYRFGGHRTFRRASIASSA
ncbi:hypothetical protein B0H13DRAFT_2269166 [Mycena leptocephala]|nr:hypothetical protein B0H13DRAFT_2269166 [Mycena leptocephala]